MADHGTRSERLHATPETWDEWLKLYANRDDVAHAYASLLQIEPPSWIGYPELNAAILRRWTPSGLNYIKEKAWKIAGI